MVKFIQENYPEAFPRTRFAAVSNPTESTSAAGPAKAFSETF
jgi:hypothetical protein